MKTQFKSASKTAKLIALSFIGIILVATVSWLSVRIQGGTFAQGQATLPLEVAEKAATWIISNATPDSGGYKWPTIWPAPTGAIYNCGIYDSGTAGVGIFLLELYDRTGNSTYLDYAKGAAQWIISEAISSLGGYWWPHYDNEFTTWPGWRLSPVVHDVGEFLLKMYDVTGNSTYLNYAEGAAQWMIANAESESDGHFIPYNPPGKYGSQAAHDIGPGREAHTMTFLLHLFRKTLNNTYLVYVKGMAEWLILGEDIRAESGGYTWIQGRPYHTYQDLNPVAQIALFFYEAYELLLNNTYLNYANGAIQWLLSKTNTTDHSGYSWPDYVDSRGNARYSLLPWEAIPEHVMDALTVGYRVTHNSTYLEYAKKHVSWILNQAITEDAGAKFPHWYGESTAGSAYANSKIYNHLRSMYTFTQNSTYLDYADKALTWIRANATTFNGGYEWKIPEAWYEEATFIGASGIGYYLIHITNASNPPVASFNYSPSLPKATETVIFNASESFDTDGTIKSFVWNFGDGNTTTASQPLITHRFMTADVYNIVLTITDDSDLSNSTSKAITVEKLNSTLLVQVSSQEIQVGENLTISGSISPKKVVANVTIMTRLENNTWVTLPIVKTDDNGQYSYVWTPSASGTYEVQANWQGDQATQSSMSALTVIKVKDKQSEMTTYVIIAVIAVGILASAGYLVRIRSLRSKRKAG